MAPIHQGGQLEIDNVTMSYSLTLPLSRQGVSALPPSASTLSAPLDQGLVAISSKMSSVGRIDAPMASSSTALRISPPTNTWSGSTQPVTITAQPSSKHSITASGTTVISTIAPISETPCTEADNNSPPLPPNPNGLRVVEICVGVLGAVIIILLLLVLIRGRKWKWIRKAKIPISEERLFEPYTMAQCLEPQSNLDKGHRRWASNTSCNTSSRAEPLQRDVPSVISVPTSEGQTMLSSPDPVYMPATPPAYSDLSCNNA
ncbi:hypothetical protein JOM56_003267 [Amanita muscaria]